MLDQLAFLKCLLLIFLIPQLISKQNVLIFAIITSGRR